MATIKDNLATIGHSLGVGRDKKWASRQLAVIRIRTPWISGRMEVIDPTTIGANDLVHFKALLETESEVPGGRNGRRMNGWELIEEPADCDPTRRGDIVNRLADEIQKRAGRGRLDWQNVGYLVPGLSSWDAKNAISALKTRGIVTHDTTDPSLYRFA